MKKKILFLCLLIISIFLIGCQEEITDEELQAELEQLSEEELDEIIELGDIEEDRSLVGEAYYEKRVIPVGKYSKVSLQRAVITARMLKFENYPKFSARVYPVNPTLTPELETVTLSNLKGDGTLKGNRVIVINHCTDSDTSGSKIPILNVYSSSNIFVYNPVDEKFKFDQASVYYYGEQALDFYTNYAEDIGWLEGRRLEIPIIKIELCHPDLGLYEEGEIRGGSFYSDTNTLLLACYSEITCSNVGRRWNDRMESIVNKYPDQGTIIHELTHGVYVPFVKDHGISNPTRRQWNQLNEAYANFMPRVHIKISSESEYGDLSNDNNFNESAYGGLDTNNILAISGALWDVGEGIGLEETGELVVKSWNDLSKFDSEGAHVAALVALVDASKQKYGISSETHINNRNIIINAFASHGIVCETCIPGS